MKPKFLLYVFFLLPVFKLSEGTNFNVESLPGGLSDLSWDEYLFDMFNNGASLVNIFAWTPGGPGYSSTHSEAAIAAYIKFLREGIIGINPIGLNSGFTLYPNPAGNSLTLKIAENNTGPYDIKLYDLIGNRVDLIHFTESIQHINLSGY